MAMFAYILLQTVNNNTIELFIQLLGTIALSEHEPLLFTLCEFHTRGIDKAKKKESIKCYKA